MVNLTLFSSSEASGINGVNIPTTESKVPLMSKQVSLAATVADDGLHLTESTADHTHCSQMSTSRWMWTFDRDGYAQHVSGFCKYNAQGIVLITG